MEWGWGYLFNVEMGYPLRVSYVVRENIPNLSGADFVLGSLIRSTPLFVASFFLCPVEMIGNDDPKAAVNRWFSYQIGPVFCE